MNVSYYYEDLAVRAEVLLPPCSDRQRSSDCVRGGVRSPAAHVGEQAAAASQFGQLVASGWHTAAISMRLFVDEVLSRIVGGAQGLGVEALTWPHPVRPGDELHVEVDVLDARPSRSRPDKGIVTVRCATLNQNGDIVQTTSQKFMAPRRAAHEAVDRRK